MKIKRLELVNYRGFESLDLTFDARLTVLIARNGAGKSSVLDALAINFGDFLTRIPDVSGKNPKKTDFRLAANGKKAAYMRITTELVNGVIWDSNEYRDKTPNTLEQVPKQVGKKTINAYADKFVDAFNHEQDFELPIFVYYGTGRGVFENPNRYSSFQKSFGRFSAYEQALESKNNFKRFLKYFYYLETLEDKLQKQQRSFDVELPQLSAIRAAIHHFMPEFSNPRTAHPAGLTVDWFKDGKFQTLRLEQLSDGYRMVLVMLMDIASRMVAANPDLADPLQSTGIVLIDEVDLHLHPSWQRDFLARLIAVFPNVQFIVTTHSPFIVQSVKKGKLIDLDSQQSPLLEIERSVEDVTEDLMGVKDIQRSQHFNHQVEIATEYYQLLDEGVEPESEQIQMLEQKLDELEQKFGDNPAHIAMLKAQRRKKLKSLGRIS